MVKLFRLSRSLSICLMHSKRDLVESSDGSRFCPRLCRTILRKTSGFPGSGASFTLFSSTRPSLVEPKNRRSKNHSPWKSTAFPRDGSAQPKDVWVAGIRRSLPNPGRQPLSRWIQFFLPPSLRDVPKGGTSRLPQIFFIARPRQRAFPFPAIVFCRRVLRRFEGCWISQRRRIPKRRISLSKSAGPH